MPTITCPTCGVLFTTKQKGADIVLTFDMTEWKVQCTSQGGADPVFCAIVGPAIRTMLLASKEKNEGCTRS